MLISVASAWQDWLRQLMADKGLNNKGLAKLVRCAKSTVTNWLAGTAPEGPYIIKLAELAGEDPRNVFAVVYNLPTGQGEISEHRRKVMRLMSVLEGLTEAEQRAVVAGVLVMVGELKRDDTPT